MYFLLDKASMHRRKGKCWKYNAIELVCKKNKVESCVHMISKQHIKRFTNTVGTRFLARKLVNVNILL